MSRGTAIAFMAHYLDAAIIEEFRRLQRASPVGTDVCMLYDNSRRDFDSSCFESADDYQLYEVSKLADTYPLMGESGTYSLVPGNCIYPMLYYAKLNPSYRHFWRVEYDVRFSGDWRAFFAALAPSEADLLGTTIFRYSFRPGWPWWKSLRAPTASLTKNDLLRGYFPVIRLSRRGCEVLEESFSSGWSGHEEVTIPTILQYRGCSIEDIGGDGEFVKPSHTNRFYTNTPEQPGLAPGTFVYRPSHEGPLTTPNMLYHPVKR